MNTILNSKERFEALRKQFAAQNIQSNVFSRADELTRSGHQISDEMYAHYSDLAEEMLSDNSVPLETPDGPHGTNLPVFETADPIDP